MKEPDTVLIRRAMAARKKRAGKQPSTSPRIQVSSPQDRRVHPRIPVTRSMIAIPLLPDGRPDWDHRVSGKTFDVSEGGMGLHLPSAGHLENRPLLVGVSTAGGSLEFEGIEVVHANRQGQSRMNVGCRFGGVGHEIIKKENLSPAFDPGSMEFSHPVPERVLREWEKVGALQRVLLDRVQLCPRCGGLPTFRLACRSCGSARVRRDRMIHHYACAHVAPVRDFEGPGELLCPKCRTRRLVVGADLEYLDGAYHCEDCRWQDSTLEQVGHCFRCGFRFPAHEAHQQDLIGYDARRLDILALVSEHR